MLREHDEKTAVAATTHVGDSPNVVLEDQRHGVNLGLLIDAVTFVISALCLLAPWPREDKSGVWVPKIRPYLVTWAFAPSLDRF
jgi:hypothetical protein